MTLFVMAKAKNKTVATNASVDRFLGTVEDKEMRSDCEQLVKLMSGATKAEPRMWGTGIVGFGERRLKYASGRELDWMLIGFAPRKTNLVVYLMDGYDRRSEQLARLGKHKVGKSCLYLNRLADVDMKVLNGMIKDSIRVVTGKV